MAVQWKSHRWSQCLIAVAGATVIAGSLVACGASGGTGGSGSSGLPSEVKLVSTNPLTGQVALAGTEANKGYDLAIKEINDSSFLGATKLALTKVDTKGNAQTAASQVSQAIADNSVSLVFGAVASDQAVAQAPLAQKQKMPIVFTQAGSAGVLVGDYTYRVSPTMPSYYPVVKKFLRDKQPKSIGIIYGSYAPTFVEITEKVMPKLGEELGFQITSKVATQATSQDFQAPISQVLADRPDMVMVLLAGATNPTAMKQLRQAGYNGPVLGSLGAGSGTLAPAGADGAGMVWPVDFNYQSPDPASQAFVAKFRTEYGADPSNYAAEAYDAAWFAARAIKNANSPDREAIKNALAAVAEQPFTGALGTNLSFKGGDLVASGMVIEWDGTKETLLYSGADL